MYCSAGERHPHSLKQRSRRLGQAREGSLESGVSRLLKCVNLESPIHLIQGSDLGITDLRRLRLQPSLELCFPKTSPGPHSQLVIGCRK